MGEIPSRCGGGGEAGAVPPGVGDAEAVGDARPDRLKLALTHEEIGQLIGASRETVTRLFSEFKDENLIQVKGTTLLLSDRPALETLAAR